MKAVMISIQPKWCELIASGKKTIEVRKTKPKLEVPFKCYIYCAKGSELWGDGSGETWKGIDETEDIEEVFRLNPTLSRLNGKVIGDFVCDSILDIPSYVGSYEDCQDYDISDDDLEKTCLGLGDLFNYNRGKPIYGWHISDLKIYDNPKELWEFYKQCPHKEKCIGWKSCDHAKEVDEKRYVTGCPAKLKRPPQGWQYAEELK